MLRRSARLPCSDAVPFPSISFFFQAEDGIRDIGVTGVQTCALPIFRVRVWDSSADVRYLVIPQRPPGTEDMSEEELAELITRDSMIGVGLPKAPAAT